MATSLDSGLCKNNNCIGGFSRLYRTIMTIKENKPQAILLNAGDNYEGTLWYNIFKWNVTQFFLNKLPTDAFTLGNHEFEDKIEGLVPFLTHLKAPMVVSNIDASKEPSLQNLLKKSVVIERNGLKIGVIGVLLASTPEIASIGNLIFLNESESVNAEAKRLVEEEKVFTNIVLSHCGYDVEQEIARNATSKISIIVGGHSHSFLYTGEPIPGPDIPVGPYPTLIKNKEGGSVLVVQASSYAKYLGNISVFYDNTGNVLDWEGVPIFLNTSLPEDEKINEELLPWKKEVDTQSGRIIGKTMVRLDQSTCPRAECLIGNFITDAMVFQYFKDEAHKNGAWTDASIAIMHAGGLRSGIDVGTISYSELISVQPFKNTIDLGEVQGRHLKEILEFSVGNNSINLLQVSGMKIIYNLTMPEGRRVTCVKVRCRECDIPKYEDLVEDKLYRLALPSFLANGGYGFLLFKKYFTSRQIGDLDIDVFLNYIEKKSPIFQEIEGRIQIMK